MPRLRHAPLGLDEPFALHAVERRVERALADLERVVGGVLDPPRDAVAVARAPGEGLEDQGVERAVQQLGRFGHASAPGAEYLDFRGIIRSDASIVKVCAVTGRNSLFAFRRWPGQHRGRA